MWNSDVKLLGQDSCIWCKGGCQSLVTEHISGQQQHGFLKAEGWWTQLWCFVIAGCHLCKDTGHQLFSSTAPFILWWSYIHSFIINFYWGIRLASKAPSFTLQIKGGSHLTWHFFLRQGLSLEGRTHWLARLGGQWVSSIRLWPMRSKHLCCGPRLQINPRRHKKLP